MLRLHYIAAIRQTRAQRPAPVSTPPPPCTAAQVRARRRAQHTLTRPHLGQGERDGVCTGASIQPVQDQGVGRCRTGADSDGHHVALAPHRAVDGPRCVAAAGACGGHHPRVLFQGGRGWGWWVGLGGRRASRRAGPSGRGLGPAAEGWDLLPCSHPTACPPGWASPAAVGCRSGHLAPACAVRQSGAAALWLAGLLPGLRTVQPGHSCRSGVGSGIGWARRPAEHRIAPHACLLSIDVRVVPDGAEAGIIHAEREVAGLQGEGRSASLSRCVPSRMPAGRQPCWVRSKQQAPDACGAQCTPGRSAPEGRCP